jgi:hypothetical protein
MIFANKMSYLPRPGQITHLVRKKAWRRIHQIIVTCLLGVGRDKSGPY